MNKAYKFRIYPNQKQQIMFAKTFGCVRFIYNRMLSDKIKHYEETKQKLDNTPAQYKKEFEWLKEVDSLALANAQMNLQKAYDNFFRSPKTGFPKFKSKHKNRKSYTTNCVNGNISIENGCIKLPKTGLVKLKQHRQIPDGYKLKSVTVSQSPSGKYYVSVLFEYENQVQEQPLHSFLGLGFSMHGLYKDSDVVTKLKHFSDTHGICLLVVHHTRKLEPADSFDMISGTNGLLGAADGAFVTQKEKRTGSRNGTTA